MQAIKYVVASLGLVAVLASAQPPARLLGNQFDMERLTALLDLDEHQKSEVERILEEQRETRAATRSEAEASGARPSFEEMRARRERAQEEMLTALRTVLTEQQLTKFKALLERPSRPPGRRAQPPFGESAI